MKKILKTISLSFIIIIIILLSSLIILKLANKNSPSKNPINFFEIVTGSMEPTLNQRIVKDGKRVKSGDIVIVIKKDINNLKEGNIISYLKDINGDGNLDVVTHRIVKIEGNNYQIKGDAIGSLDETISKEELSNLLVGKVLFNRKSYVITFIFRVITSIIGFLLVVVLPIFILIVKSIIELIHTLNSNKEKTKIEAAINSLSKEELDQIIEEAKAKDKINQ